MTIRRAATLISTWLVAIVVALAVPAAQLRTVSVVKACCCPDPNFCHCPDHAPGHSDSQPTMGACHRTQHELASPQLPAFAPPVIARVEPPVRAIETPTFTLAIPHVAPAPARPDAPS